MIRVASPVWTVLARWVGRRPCAEQACELNRARHPWRARIGARHSWPSMAPCRAHDAHKPVPHMAAFGGKRQVWRVFRRRFRQRRSVTACHAGRSSRIRRSERMGLYIAESSAEISFVRPRYLCLIQALRSTCRASIKKKSAPIVGNHCNSEVDDKRLFSGAHENIALALQIAVGDAGIVHQSRASPVVWRRTSRGWSVRHPARPGYRPGCVQGRGSGHRGTRSIGEYREYPSAGGRHLPLFGLKPG